MNELNNTATSIGNYNNIPTSLTSNVSVVNIIDGLSLTKEADKKNWGSGELTYTITIDNQTDTSYVKPIVTDKIDTSLVEFVTGSVMINDTPATESQFSYDAGTSTLTINLDDVGATSKTTLTFRVTKKSVINFLF